MGVCQATNANAIFPQVGHRLFRPARDETGWSYRSFLISTMPSAIPHSMEATAQAVDKASAEGATICQPGATPQGTTRDDFRGLKARPLSTQEFPAALENRQAIPRAEPPIDVHRYPPWEHRRDYGSGLQPSGPIRPLRGESSGGIGGSSGMGPPLVGTNFVFRPKGGPRKAVKGRRNTLIGRPGFVASYSILEVPPPVTLRAMHPAPRYRSIHSPLAAGRCSYR